MAWMGQWAHKKVMQQTVSGVRTKEENRESTQQRGELIGLGRMRQATDNRWADWPGQMMETLRVSHGPSCFSPLRDEAVTAGPLTVSIWGSNHRLGGVCALIIKTIRMMSLRQVGMKTGNSGIRGGKSQGLLQKSWIWGIYSLCFLLLHREPYSAFSVTRWIESQTFTLNWYKQSMVWGPQILSQ